MKYNVQVTDTNTGVIVMQRLRASEKAARSAVDQFCLSLSEYLVHDDTRIGSILWTMTVDGRMPGADHACTYDIEVVAI